MATMNNRVAIVTGGNSGKGYATAKELKAQGATVIITGRRREAIEKAAAELGVTGLVADQGSLADIDALAAQVSKEYGKVDILFINAGVAHLSTIADATEAHYDSIMNVNLKGAFFTLSKFIPLLQDGGAVIFLSSNTATKTGAGSSVYGASKAALNSFVKAAALELAPRKITVNSVSPGPIVTEIMKKSGLGEDVLAGLNDHLTQRIPVRRMGSGEEVAKMVAHLAGAYGTFITGADFIMDGGMVLA